MRRKYISGGLKTGLLFLICMASSCNPPKNKNHKVIVVHARGISYPDMAAYLNSTQSDSFFKRNEAKGFIKKLVPITNAVTICNIASFETGTLPSEHGIIGHAFGLRENDAIKITSGFARRFTKETFWEKADINGKKVLNVGALTLHGKYNTHANVDCLAQGTQVRGAQMLRLIPDDETRGDSMIKYTTPDGDYTFPLQRGNTDSLRMYTIDQGVGIDELIIDDDYNNTNGVIATLKRGDWCEIVHDNDNKIKEAFRVKWVPASSDTLTLYIRGAFANRGYPDEFLEHIDAGPGPSRGWPNIPFYAAGQITDTTVIEEIHSELDYVMNVFSFAAQQKDYDLIMIDYPLMDRMGHAFLRLKDSSRVVQKQYSDAFNRMDKDFRRIADFAKQNGYELIITSGHGFAPVHTSIDLNTFLRKSGINTDSHTTDWEAVGVPGKVSSHIYINNRLSPHDKASVLSAIENAFKNLEHPVKKLPVVDAIYRKDNVKETGLFHEHAGELYIMLNPGFVFANNGGKEDTVFGIPVFMGDHGYSLKHESSFGTLISTMPCEPCQSIDISKIIEEKLNLK